MTVDIYTLHVVLGLEIGFLDIECSTSLVLYMHLVDAIDVASRKLIETIELEPPCGKCKPLRTQELLYEPSALSCPPWPRALLWRLVGLRDSRVVGPMALSMQW